jgi:hypothetical protein
MTEIKYTEDEVKTLDWREHIRLRPVCTSGNWAMVPPPTMEYMYC